MGSITVRNLDDGVISALRAVARANGRSLEAEVRHILTLHVGRAVRLNEFRQRTLQLLGMAPEGPQTDSVELLREDRGR